MYLHYLSWSIAPGCRGGTKWKDYLEASGVAGFTSDRYRWIRSPSFCRNVFASIVSARHAVAVAEGAYPIGLAATSHPPLEPIRYESGMSGRSQSELIGRLPVCGNSPMTSDERKILQTVVKLLNQDEL
ncbi:unnamed protein product [Nezara viridula]|uniref:Uncharacterized protein n=1 Tax=Nezara viridula TaxID=85310 RepID=A0A9P0H218_NEZVI|nr:unnamed protein product [Nezara viridula]